jgi:hypothetical protein
VTNYLKAPQLDRDRSQGSGGISRVRQDQESGNENRQDQRAPDNLNIAPISILSPFLPMKALIAIIFCTAFLASCSQSEPVKPSIEDKLTQLKEMRAEKKTHQNAIFTIDQKIVPLKCGIYSDV